MSFITTTNKSGNKVVSLKCDHKNCTNSFSGASKGETGKLAREARWLCPSASEHYCQLHRAEHGSPARGTKAEKVTKKVTKKEAKNSKAGKTTVTKSGTKVSVGRKPVATKEANSQFGQSIGKKARIAKLVESAATAS